MSGPDQSEIAGLRAEIAELRESLRQAQETFQGSHVPTSFEMLAGAALLALPPLRLPELPPALARADRLLTANRQVLALLEWAVTRRLAVADHEAVLNLSKAAGDWCSTHHPAGYTSHVLEKALRSVGQTITAPETVAVDPGADGRPSVVHVLSEAHAIGGHTRLAIRWMMLDATRRHVVVLTDQRDHPVPQELLDATGGNCHSLQAATPFARARELATLASSHDVAVLHVHPDDAVAVVAAQSPIFPPTVFLDHGDHLFWLGVSSASALASLRDSGRDIAVRRRSVDPEQVVHVPLPLDLTPPAPVSAAAARARLGLPDSALVLLTVASAHKYGEVPRWTFTDHVAEVLERHPHAVLVAVGPDPDSAQWRRLRARFGDRVRVPGVTPDLDDLRRAADIYLDSFPFASLTSLFEAALLDVPVVLMRLPEAGPMALDDPHVNLPVSTDFAQWHKRIDQLATSADLRRSEGAALSAALREHHSATRVQDAIEEVYRVATTSPRFAVPPDADAAPEATDAYVAVLQDASRLGRPAVVLLASYGLLPGFLSG